MTGAMERSAGFPRHREPGAGDAACGDFGIRIGRDGSWFYHGSPIGRKPLVRLFASLLRREGDGSYWLVTPAECGRIVVDDAPFVAVELSALGRGTEQVLRLRTNVDDEIVVDRDHGLRVAHDSASGEPRPYVMVRDRLEALLLRSVYYHLVELGQVRRVGDGEQFGVWSSGVFFPLGGLE
jgi:hypothetical protein